MTHFAHESLRGRYVKFRVNDIHVPDPAVVLQHLHGGDTLQGRVVDFSDGGSEASTFLVIEVDGLRQPCILAAHLVKLDEPS